VTTVDMDALKASDPGLHRRLAKTLDLTKAFGTQEINLREYIEPTRHAVLNWLDAQEKAALPPPAPTEPQIKMSEVEEDLRRDIQKRADSAAARNRLNEWAAGGLEDTQANADLITEWIRQNAKGYFSAIGVDAAISLLGQRGTNQLTWRKVEVAPASQPEPESTGLTTLKDGTQPLSLLATNSQIKAATKEQAKDWLRRYELSKGLSRSQGRFGSRF
jgi:hypothetical protein